MCFGVWYFSPLLEALIAVAALIAIAVPFRTVFFVPSAHAHHTHMQVVLRRRLGWLRTFDPRDVEGHFDLDCSKKEVNPPVSPPSLHTLDLGFVGFCGHMNVLQLLEKCAWTTVSMETKCNWFLIGMFS